MSAHGLASRIRSECGVLDGEVARIVNALQRFGATADEAAMDAAALRLQLWYTGQESLLAAILLAVDGDIPDGEAWHKELCEQAFRASATRGPILPAELRPALDQARAFRHRVRNAYGLSFDPAKLGDVARTVIAVHPRLVAALQQCADALDAG